MHVCYLTKHSSTNRPTHSRGQQEGDGGGEKMEADAQGNIDSYRGDLEIAVMTNPREDGALQLR